jgi:SecD/SecF fusion protein
MVSVSDTAKINSYFKRQVFVHYFHDKRLICMGKPTESVDEKTKKVSELVELYALKGNKDNQAPMSGVRYRDT